MTLKQRLQNPFVQQYLLEILLPVIGYFFFDWSLLIIAAFYLLDQLAAEISFLRKFKAIRKSENKPSRLFFSVSVMLILVLLTLELVLLLNYFAASDFDRNTIFAELTIFAKEELWLLFPLVLLMNYMKDQFTFFMPRRYLQKDSMRYFKWHWIENFFLLVIILLGTWCGKKLVLPAVLVIAIFMVLKLTFDFTVARMSDKKSNK